MGNQSTLRPIAYIGGTFDLFHHGHVKLFMEAKNQLNNPIVVVALNTDDFAERYKKRRPIMNLVERCFVIDSCRWVDRVLINYGGEDSKPSIVAAMELYPGVRPRYIMHGDDWVGDSLMKQLGVTQEWMDSQKIELKILHNTKIFSTTALIERIKDQ